MSGKVEVVQVTSEPASHSGPLERLARCSIAPRRARRRAPSGRVRPWPGVGRVPLGETVPQQVPGLLRGERCGDRARLDVWGLAGGRLPLGFVGHDAGDLRCESGMRIRKFANSRTAASSRLTGSRNDGRPIRIRSVAGTSRR